MPGKFLFIAAPKPCKRAFAAGVASLLAERNPDLITDEPRKEKRAGRLLVDYFRNAYGQTAVCPFAVRALESAPVATPLEWDELADPELSAQRFTMKNIFRRLSQKKDPWREINQRARSLSRASKKLEKLVK